ncbi:MAG: dihydrofolate reductase [Bdellovibrio sp.]|nr:dihydrofolate reductase [Bdellovibrio sp.]
MIKGHVFIATSLDGFIARPDGDIAWLLKRDDPSEDHGYNSFMANIDGIIMGRGTYEKVAAMEQWYYEKPVIVLSKTLRQQDLPARLADKVRIMNLTPREIMKLLEEQSWKHVYVDGEQVIQSFLRENLIDDLVITQVPVLIGQGLSLFGSINEDISLKLLKTTPFPSGLLQTHYKICQN